MAQAFCHVCYGTSLTFENGVLVCDTCGTQTQARFRAHPQKHTPAWQMTAAAIAATSPHPSQSLPPYTLSTTNTQTFQEEAEYQAGIDDTRGKRRAAGSSGVGQQSQATLLAREEELATQQLQTAALAYVRCLQQLLKVCVYLFALPAASRAIEVKCLVTAVCVLPSSCNIAPSARRRQHLCTLPRTPTNLQVQAEVLTSRFGVSTQVASVLRQVWLSHLPSTGMLEPLPRQPAAAAAAAREAAAGDEGNDSDADTDAAGGSGEQRVTMLVAPKNMKQLFWKVRWVGGWLKLDVCWVFWCACRQHLRVSATCNCSTVLTFGHCVSDGCVATGRFANPVVFVSAATTLLPPPCCHHPCILPLPTAAASPASDAAGVPPGLCAATRGCDSLRHH